VTDRTGALIHSEVVDVPASVMMHDFAITERDVVFWDLPVAFDLAGATKWATDPSSGALPFRWAPDQGARVGIMPLGGPASAITWYPLDEPCYVFHGVNAYRDGASVVVDVCRMTSMFESGTSLGGSLSLRRWTVDTATGRVTDDVIEADDPGELPTRDPRRVGRKHRYGYLAQWKNPPDGAVEIGGLIKHDYLRESRETWRPPAGQHAGEWLFIPADGESAEDAGYLLSYLFDDATRTSQLVIIDASEVKAGPVARVALPQRVPYGFHAAWVPA
jgi:carotenoid cleavage dioxygenase